MPQRPSAVKTLRKNKENHIKNKSIKSRLHTETRKFERAVERGDSGEASEQLDTVIKLLHKAVVKSALHKNTAARKQSRLQAHLNSIENND